MWPEVFAEAYLATQTLVGAEQVWPYRPGSNGWLEACALPVKDLGADGVLRTWTDQFNAHQVKFRTGHPALTWQEQWFLSHQRLQNQVSFAYDSGVSAGTTQRSSIAEREARRGNAKSYQLAKVFDHFVIDALVTDLCANRVGRRFLDQHDVTFGNRQAAQSRTVTTVHSLRDDLPAAIEATAVNNPGSVALFENSND